MYRSSSGTQVLRFAFRQFNYCLQLALRGSQPSRARARARARNRNRNRNRSSNPEERARVGAPLGWARVGLGRVKKLALRLAYEFAISN